MADMTAMTQYRLNTYMAVDSKNCDYLNTERTYTEEVLLLRIRELLKNDLLLQFIVTRLPPEQLHGEITKRAGGSP